MTDALWKELLRLPLSQRLEWNPIENALKAANILSAPQIKEIRTQAANTATAWSSQESDGVMALLRAHSSPLASLSVPQPPEE